MASTFIEINGGGHKIQDEGIDLQSRSDLNFIGSGVTVDDFGGATRVTIGAAGAIDTVNTQTGTVVLDPDDLDDTSTTSKFTTAAEITKLAGIAAGAEVNLKELWFSPGADNGNQDSYAVDSVTSNGAAHFAFRVPSDFVSLVTLEVVLFTNGNVVTGDIDLNSSYAAVGEDRVTNMESDTTATYNFTADEISVIDISGVFTSIAANDLCGLEVDQNGLGTTAHYLGIRLRYS